MIFSTNREKIAATKDVNDLYNLKEIQILINPFILFESDNDALKQIHMKELSEAFDSNYLDEFIEKARIKWNKW